MAEPTPATPKVEVKVTKTSTPKQGLAADAQAAKAEHEATDQRVAATHQELRDSGKIVEQSPLRGYESVRENMYVQPEERVDTPPEELEGGEPIKK